MSGRPLLLPLIFFSLLSSGVLQLTLDKYPFHLLPIVSPDGLTTEVGDCIGALVSDEHILALKSCLQLPGGMATGVFADYRETKEYPADPELYPVSEYLFSKNITVHPESEFEFALITLHVPFKSPSDSIHPVVVGNPGGNIMFQKRDFVSFKRDGQVVKAFDSRENNYAEYAGGKLFTLNGNEVNAACDFLKSTTGNKVECNS